MKVYINTIVDNNNYGNRLQNYALQEYIKKHTSYDVYTMKNIPTTNMDEKSIIKNTLRYLKMFALIFRNKINNNNKNRLRIKKFTDFNDNIKFNKKYFNFITNHKFNKDDYFVVGSDQVWNYNFSRLRDFDLLNYTESKNKISFSASFGVSELPKEYKERTKKALEKFKKISVREDAGKRIVENLTGREDVEVLVDPTMLLSAKEWDKVAKRPEQLKKDKYILNYFLGELSDKRKKEIERVAKENDCEIINILDKNSPFYQTGPSEFLYLEKNAFLICTDSFHSCVFAIIYNRPFIVFDREDSNVSMNSRIETLLSKFMLQDRKYNGKITEEQLKNNYENAYKILEKEKEKAYQFLNTALDIKENEIERK